MPSSSRKRNKGQARKARAKATAANATTNIIFEQTFKLGNTTCNLRHGQPETFPDVCNIFMTRFLTSFRSSTDQNLLAYEAATIALESAYNKYPEAVNKDANRDILKRSLLALGAQYFIGFSKLSANGASSVLGMDSHNSPLPLGFAAVSMVIDTCAPSSPLPPGTFDERDASTFLRNLDIVNGCQRSLVKYYVNQIPCNCLDEMYSKMKSTSPQNGSMCELQTKERKKQNVHMHRL